MKTEQNGVSIRPLGDSALVIQLGEGISTILHKKIINLVDLIENDPFDGFIEVVPSYNNVTIYYDPVTIRLKNSTSQFESSFKQVSDRVKDYIERINDNELPQKRFIEIPVLYGNEFGPDLEYIATYNKIPSEKVIELHTEKEYLVYMLGFAPGFPFFGGVDKRISTPRKEKPRPAIPAGSVGIAGEQTGVYPIETPGGWQVIGRTPVNLFNPEMSSPTLLQPGDRVRFTPITREEYFSYKEKKQ